MKAGMPTRSSERFLHRSITSKHLAKHPEKGLLAVYLVLNKNTSNTSNNTRNEHSRNNNKTMKKNRNE